MQYARAKTKPYAGCWHALILPHRIASLWLMNRDTVHGFPSHQMRHLVHLCVFRAGYGPTGAHRGLVVR